MKTLTAQQLVAIEKLYVTHATITYATDQLLGIVALIRPTSAETCKTGNFLAYDAVQQAVYKLDNDVIRIEDSIIKVTGFFNYDIEYSDQYLNKIADDGNELFLKQTNHIEEEYKRIYKLDDIDDETSKDLLIARSIICIAVDHIQESMLA